LKNDKDYLSIRRDLYHNKWIPDEEKARLIEEYRNDAIMSQTELLAMFPVNSGMFNIADFMLHWSNPKEFNINGIKFKFKDDAEQLKKEYKAFVVGYDPALLKDKGGCSVFGVREISESNNGLTIKKNIFEIVGAAYINIIDYSHQIDVLCSLQEVLMDLQHPVYFGMDYTGAGM
jgi:hypothetical protein